MNKRSSKIDQITTNFNHLVKPNNLLWKKQLYPTYNDSKIFDRMLIV